MEHPHIFLHEYVFLSHCSITFVLCDAENHRQTNCLSLFIYRHMKILPFGNLRPRAFIDTNWLIKLHCLKFNSCRNFFMAHFSQYEGYEEHTKCVFDDDMRFDFLFQQVNIRVMIKREGRQDVSQ